MCWQLRSFALSSILLLSAAVPSFADVPTMPAIFSEHMVLQQGVKLPVWGWAKAGEKVVVSIAGQSKETAANDKGEWKVTLEPLSAGGPLTMSIKSDNEIFINDILVGEVWLASGQSNMGMTVHRVKNYEAEQSKATFPSLRMFTVSSFTARTPQANCKGSWVVCSPDTVGRFSATAYFFGRELHEQLKTPVGMINSSVGGTPIEAWTSEDVQKAKSELEPLFASWNQRADTYDPEKDKARFEKQTAAYKTQRDAAKAAGKQAPRPPQPVTHPRDMSGHPAGLFNGKIAPLIPFAIRGAIWYQGESNAKPESAALYKLQLQLLVNDWRSRWQQGDFPFAWVQLPNFDTKSADWPLVREAMLENLALPNTGMAITLDVGDPKDIHPANKQDVGKRLAMWGLAKVYGQKMAASGPLPVSFQASGASFKVSFEHVDGGLKTQGDELKEFELAGDDGVWKKAAAKIDGEQVIVTSPDVAKPVAVRYAWSNNPTATLFNGAGLPASPFRSKAP